MTRKLILIETLGAFGLLTGFGAIAADRPSVTVHDSFVDTQKERGNVHIISKLNDDATDEELQRYFNESKSDNRDEKGKVKDSNVNELALAIDSFLSKFGDGEAEPSVKVAEAEGDEAKAQEVKAQAQATAAEDNAALEKERAAALEATSDARASTPVTTDSTAAKTVSAGAAAANAKTDGSTPVSNNKGTGKAAAGAGDTK